MTRQNKRPHSGVKTGRSPESFPSGMVLFRISFCFSSGSAGKKNQRGAKGNRKRENSEARRERNLSAVRYEKKVRGRLKVPEIDRKEKK